VALRNRAGAAMTCGVRVSVSTGEALGGDVFGGQEARAASAAGDGSPRGPVVLVRHAAFVREPSSFWKRRNRSVSSRRRSSGAPAPSGVAEEAVPEKQRK
jgi:hypothetical protein